MSTTAGCPSASLRGCFSRFFSALVRVQEGERRQPARGSGCRPGGNTRVGVSGTGVPCVSASWGPAAHWGLLDAYKTHRCWATSHADLWVWVWPSPEQPTTPLPSQGAGSTGLGSEALTHPSTPRLREVRAGREEGHRALTGCLAVSEAFRVFGQGQCFLENRKGNPVRAELRRAQANATPFVLGLTCD